MIIPRIKQEKYSDKSIYLHSGINIKPDNFDVSKKTSDLFKYVCGQNHILADVNSRTKLAYVVELKCDDNCSKFDEYYHIIITEEKTVLTFKDYLGGRNAVFTLISLLKENAAKLPCGEFIDWPDSTYRSLLLDPARKYIPIEELKDILWMMAKAKYNKLHLHLLDSGAYAIKSEVFPQLNKSPKQYTKQEMRKIIQHAGFLGIDVIPELEMPAHAQLFVQEIPQVQCKTPEGKPSVWVMCAGSEYTYAMIAKLIGEIADIFPSKYIHIGGDELEFSDLTDLEYWPTWDECECCKSLCKREGLQGKREIFYYFINRVYNILKTYGKKMIMWNDGIDISKSPNIPRDILIQYWRIAMKHRGPHEGISVQRFLEEGFQIINSDYPETYLDLYMQEEKLRTWSPVARPESDSKYHNQILGSEMCLWEGCKHFAWSMPSAIPLFADRMWNHKICEYNRKYGLALTKHVMGAGFPDNINIFDALGGHLMPLNNKDMGYPKNVKITPEQSNDIKAVLTEYSALDIPEKRTAKTYVQMVDWIEHERIKYRKLTYEQYLDKVHGAWLGKSLGGCSGALVEGIKHRVNKSYQELLDTSIANDDLDFQLMWLELLEEKGPYLTQEDMSKAWIQKCWYPFAEYGYFIKNFKRGISAPYSGNFNNSFFMDSMGCPIRSEIWAVINPGCPEEAVKMAKMDAELDHANNAVNAEMYLAVLQSLAFIDNDILNCAKKSLEYIDKNSRLFECLNTVISGYENGESFESGLMNIYRNYSHPDFSNCIQNIGIIMLGVLYGEGNMDKTLNLTLSCGYDADCTCATAGAIVGIIKGYSGIEKVTRELGNGNFVCGIDVYRPDNSILTLSKDCCKVGLGLLKLRDNSYIEITDVPENIVIPQWKDDSPDTYIDIDYENMPAIGVNDSCVVIVTIHNERNQDPLFGELSITGLKNNWNAEYDKGEFSVSAYGEKKIRITVSTGELSEIDQTNILKVAFKTRDLVVEKEFGIAGAVIWKLYGPYFEAPNWEHKTDVPNCHDGYDLPTIEALVNNSVELDKKYLDEDAILNNAENYNNCFIGYINAYEDLIPIETVVKNIGQCGFIAVSDVYFNEDTRAWVVIGNNDAFKVYLNGEEVYRVDELRFWTPINNSFIGNFKKGKNRIVLKLLRRTDILKFSIGIKHYDNKHFHRTTWYHNLKYGVIK